MHRALIVTLVGVVVAFVAIPIASVFGRVPVSALLDGVASTAARQALLLSVETTAISLGIMLVVGTPVAYVLATHPFRGSGLIATLLELPIVMPPAVAGIALLAAFGRLGTVGGWLDALGLQIPFTTTAVVLAQLFVASPFYLRQAQAAFAATDPQLLAAARSCGAGPVRTMTRVAMPIAAGGLATGAALGWARALGEFGATLLFAGSFPGVTQTAPLAIYALNDTSTAAALGVAAVLVGVAIAILVGIRIGASRWQRW